MTVPTAARPVRSVQYGDVRIEYLVRRRADRHAPRVAIHVEYDGRVLVDAPADASDAHIHQAVAARVRWIHRHVSAARTRMAEVLPREYVSGEALLYLGRRYRLRVTLVEADERGAGAVQRVVQRTTQRSTQQPARQTALHDVRLKGGFIEVTTTERNPDRVRRMLTDWYRARARAILGTRLDLLATRLRWVRQVPPMRLQAMRVQWGSCSPAGRLTLNPLLVRAPRECIDYVLLHELCHLRHHHHGPAFYRTLDAHLPNWRALKKRLDGLAEQVLNV